MKQKMSNRILAIYNIVVCAIIIGLGLWGTLGQFGLKYPLSSAQYADAYHNALYFIDAIFIVLTIVNIIFLIQNRKTKKMIYWFLIPTIYYFCNSLALFVTIPDFLTLMLWTAVPAIVLVINLIYEITHEKKIKTIVLQLLGIILALILFLSDFYISKIWLLISLVMIFIYSKKSEDKSKAIKIINTIIIILLVGLLITFIVAFMNVISKMQKADKETAELIDTIETGLEKEKMYINNILIPVSQDGKWGYIDTTGKEIIPCEYDLISSDDSDYFGKHQYPVVVAKKENKFYMFATNGTLLAQTSDNPILWLYTDFMSTYADPAFALVGLEKLISDYVYYEPTSLRVNENPTIDFDEYNHNLYDYPVYTYNMEDDYILEFEAEDKEEKTFTLRLKKDGKILDAYEKVRYESSDYIETYKNGDIPFYSFEKDYQGYYSVRNHEIKVIKGDYEILNVLDDYIIIKDWRNSSKTQDYLVNKDNKILLKAPLICSIKDGFIIQDDNGKFSYLNSSLETVAEDYDFIDDAYIINNVLICMKKVDNNNTDYTLITTQGKTLTNKKYSIMHFEVPQTDKIKKYYNDFQCETLNSEYNDFYLNSTNNTKREKTKNESSKKDSENDSDSNTVSESSSELTFSKVTTENYGDYIDLGINLVGNKTTEDDWQILYNDTHNGKIYAILSDYLPIDSDFLKKVNPSLECYNNEISSNSVDDLIKAFDSKEWKSLVSEDLQDIVDVKGAAPAQIIVDSYNEKHKTNDHNPYFYNIPEDESSGLDNLYVLPTANDEDNINYHNYYWLSDKTSDSKVLSVTYWGYISPSDYDAALRPIVVIPSNQGATVKKENGKIVWKIAE